MHVIKGVIAGWLMVMAGQAAAVNWLSIVRSVDQTVYIDPDSISRHGQSVEFRDMVRNRKSGPKNELIMAMTGDCTKSTLTHRMSIMMSMAENVLKPGQNKPEHVLPGSPDAAILKYVCNFRTTG